MFFLRELVKELPSVFKNRDSRMAKFTKLHPAKNDEENRKKKRKLYVLETLSLCTRLAKCFAPTMIQVKISSLIFEDSIVVDAST